MSAAFITVTLDDDAGQVLVNVADISSIGPAKGHAKGSRIILRRKRVLNVVDPYARLRDALRDAGLVKD